jgi:hypothetical protein
MGYKAYVVVVSNLAPCMDAYPYSFVLCCVIGGKVLAMGRSPAQGKLPVSRRNSIAH